MARIQNKLPFSFDELSEEGKSFVAASLAVRRGRIQWRGMPAVPPGSLLDEILHEFYSNTNIALEIPFITFLHYISGFLIGKEVCLKYGQHSIEMDFWTVVLARSGAGKTWTENQIREGLDSAVPMFPGGTASAARFIEELEARPRALWIRDEYLQLIRQVEIEGGPLAELKDYLLRIYDNSRIERITKKESIVVERPVLSVLGFNALQSFADGMSAESLVDGFAQRFGYTIARPDVGRPMKDYPVWAVNKEGWNLKFFEMFKNVRKEYIALDDAESRFREIFELSLGKLDLDESFYRRIMWRAHKYAVIYHIIRGAGGDKNITGEDYGWAARLIEMQLADSADLIEMCSGTELSKAIEAGDAVIKKLIADGLPITARNIVMRTRLIKSVGIARLVLNILGIPEAPGRRETNRT